MCPPSRTQGKMEQQLTSPQKCGPKSKAVSLGSSWCPFLESSEGTQNRTDAAVLLWKPVQIQWCTVSISKPSLWLPQKQSSGFCHQSYDKKIKNKYVPMKSLEKSVTAPTTQHTFILHSHFKLLVTLLPFLSLEKKKKLANIKSPIRLG